MEPNFAVDETQTLGTVVKGRYMWAITIRFQIKCKMTVLLIDLLRDGGISVKIVRAYLWSANPFMDTALCHKGNNYLISPIIFSLIII